MRLARANHRDYKTLPQTVVMVSPKGELFDHAVNNTLNSVFLQVTVRDDDSGKSLVTFVSEVHIRPQAAELGFALLHDLYKVENNLAGFQEYQRWQEYARQCLAQERKPDEFPVEGLPVEVQKRRRGEAAHQRIEPFRLRASGGGADEIDARPRGRGRAAEGSA